jgi:hypothetical protein
MERGLRFIHPGVLDVVWHDSEGFSKPKIVSHPFTLQFHPTIKMRDYEGKTKLAMVATFR